MAESIVGWELRRIADLPDDRIDLSRAALWVAKLEYPDLAIDAYARRLDGLAADARPFVRKAGDNPFAVIDALNTFLFTKEGFTGNATEYFDPRNSYLNDVLDRRRGIPITLSVIYLEIAGRVGFPLQGVGFPGHFMVRHADAGREILIDPFHGGQILVPDDCRKRLEAIYGEDVPLQPRFFETAGKKQILVRMLNNLKHIHIKRDDHERALKVLDMLEAIAPGDPEHLRDRGLVNMGLNRLGSAAADLQAYLLRAPSAPDVTGIRKRLKSIRRLTAMLN